MRGILARLSGWLHAARARLGAALRGRRLDRELDEELEFHLEQATRENRRAGMTEREARRAARRALGSPARIRDQHRDARGTRWLDDLRQDVAYGLRRLGARPWISLAAVATLALGIGAVTTVYGAVHALLLEPLPFPELDRIVVLDEARRGEAPDGEGWVHPGDYRDWRDLPVFQETAALARWLSVPMVGAGEPVEVFGYRTGPEYFRVLGIDALHGRTLAVGPDGVPGPEIVLSHRFWRTHFGADPEAVGRTVRMAGREMTIVGVLPAGAEYPMGTDVWGPLDLSADAWSSEPPRTGVRVAAIARLAPGRTLEQARAALRASSERIAEAYPDTHSDLEATAVPMLETITHGTRPLLLFLMGGAGCLLLLVCANVANLQLMSATTRRREVAVRTALGAGRPRIVRQLLTESLCLGLFGCAAGALLAVWGSRAIRAHLSGDWWRFFFIGARGIDVDVPTLLFAVLVALASTLLFGLAPALRGTRVDPARALEGAAGRSTGDRGRGRAALVVLEVALSLVLVWGALLMTRAVGSLSSVDLGFDDEVATLSLNPRAPRYEDPVALREFLGESLAAVAGLPGIEAAALVDHVPGLGIRRRTPVKLGEPVGDDDGIEEIRTAAVSPGYFATLGISILSGRGFDASDTDGGAATAVVSETLARRLSVDGRVVGHRIDLAEEDTTLIVVGVAADVDGAYDDPRPRPVLYRPRAQLPPRSMQLLLRPTDDVASVAPAVRARLWRIDPDIPLTAPRTVDDLVAERGAPLRMATGLMGAFAAIALLLCLGGVHAVVAYAASLRTREVGVRMALGADRGSVSRLFGRRGLRLSAVGVLVGLPLAYAFGSLLSRGLSRFLPGGGGVSAVALLGLAATLLVLGTLAGWLPGRRAARVDPATTLRAE